MVEKFDIIIIGAGVAGLMAAGHHGEAGISVLLLEKMQQPARKLRITGKGRCNLTNTLPMHDFLKHVGSDSHFLEPAFTQFFNHDLMQFFEKKGVALVTERGNRVFPKSGKAQDIFYALISWVEKQRNITILKNSPVKNLVISNGSIHGVSLENGTQYSAKSVMLATGGKSYPLTGSTGDGYRMAKQAGHSLSPLYPSLVPINVKENVRKLKDLELKNVEVSVFRNDKPIAKAFGDMTFTETGITGPIVLTLSRQLTQLLNSGEKLNLSIDLKPALSNIKLDNRIALDIEQFSNLKFSEILRKWLPAPLAWIAPNLLQINPYTISKNLSGTDREKLRTWMKGFPLTAVDTQGFDEAIVTQGGVSLNEVDEATMQSKIVKGLFFAGEILDLDADTGGYNLQIAFSTAYLAARKAVDFIKIP